MSVVPDSIVPVEGWKSWDIMGGLLCSPNHEMFWVPGEEVCANCTLTAYPFLRWEVTTERPVVPPGDYEIVGNSMMPAPPRPSVVLPQGLYWRLALEDSKHEAPGRSCSCGIYIAKDPTTAFSYGDILGKVAGWGTVIEHKQGWRVQYAYPTELRVYSQELADLLEPYGVPVIVDPNLPIPLKRTPYSDVLHLVVLIAVCAMALITSVFLINNPTRIGAITTPLIWMMLVILVVQVRGMQRG